MSMSSGLWRAQLRRRLFTDSARICSTTSGLTRPSLLVQSQQQRNFSLSGLNWDNIWQSAPRRGTGFDNFFRDSKKKQKSQESKEGGSRNDNGGGGQSPWNGMGGAAIAFAIVMSMVMGLGEDRRDSLNASKGQAPEYASREISWHDLLGLLQKGMIQKIVVSSPHGSTSARVYLKNRSGRLMSAASDSHDSLQEHSETERFDFTDQKSDVMEGLEKSSSATLGGMSSSPPPLFYTLRIGSVEAFEKKLEEVQRALGKDPVLDVPVQFTFESNVAAEIMNVLPWLIVSGIFLAAARGASAGFSATGGGKGGMGGIFQIGRSTAKKITKEDVSVDFSSVAGCDEAKKEIMEFVDFLKKPDRFTKLGAKIPKGALLCGPPGTGKTLLAKAVAGEAGVPFFTVSGSDFVEMFVGVGPSRVRDLFSEARSNAPCIVFIDEIDAVGRQRGRGRMGGNDERENTLNQLLVEMDGFEPSTGVVVLAGTNRVDILDQALTRPGRFDRKVTVDKPDLKGRKEIFKVHLKGITLEEKVDDIAGRLAGLTPGFAGADIENICNEAAIVAARRQADSVSMQDFEKATDRIIGGLESNKIISKEERNIVAHHEAGHAVAGWFLEHADPLLKVTIIPRSSGALGFAQYLPKEVFLRTQEQIMDIVSMALAGRAAEEIFFGRVTTGASDDLRRVTDLVYSTIQVYGMNPRLGQLAFPKDPGAMFEERPYSEKTAKAMDEEAKSIVDAAYERTLTLLRERKSEVEKVANMLLEKETINHDDIVDMIGPRPFAGDKSYDEFIQRNRTKEKPVESDVSDANANDSSTEDGSEHLNPGLACR